MATSEKNVSEVKSNVERSKGEQDKGGGRGGVACVRVHIDGGRDLICMVPGRRAPPPSEDQQENGCNAEPAWWRGTCGRLFHVWCSLYHQQHHRHHHRIQCDHAQHNIRNDHFISAPLLKETVSIPLSDILSTTGDK